MINQDCQSLSSICGARREIMIGSGLRNIQPHQSDEQWKSIVGSPESNQLVEFDLKVGSLKIVDAQG